MSLTLLGIMALDSGGMSEVEGGVALEEQAAVVALEPTGGVSLEPGGVSLEPWGVVLDSGTESLDSVLLFSAAPACGWAVGVSPPEVGVAPPSPAQE